MILYDEKTIAAAPWPDTEWGRQARGLISPLVQEGSTPFFSDRTTVRVIGLDDLLIPITLNDAEYDNSPICSMYTRLITLPRAGISHMGKNPAVSWLLRQRLDGLGALCKAARINQCIYVDAWIALRNLVVSSMTADQMKRLTEALVSRFPDHAVVFASLNTAMNAPLLNQLQDHGYSAMLLGHSRLLLPYKMEMSRQERENRRRDARLLEESGYQMGDARDFEGAASRLAELYRLLNREKYTSNPVFTEKYFERTLRSGAFTYRVAVKEGRIDGFYGFMVKDDTLYSSPFGYDVNLPQEVGLYRMLVYHLVQEALDRGLALETGGGADKFKSMRGDKPVPRYNAVFFQHLSPFRRSVWGLLERYTNGPILRSTQAYLRKIDGDAVVGFEPRPRTFTPPFISPKESVALLRQELASLRDAIDTASTQHGEELARSLAILSEKLNNWPQPTRLVVELREKLVPLEQRLRREQKAREESAQASPTEVAAALLKDAARLGDVSLVIGNLEGATSQHLRAVADSVLKAAPSTAVLLATRSGDKAVLYATMTQDLIQRGVGAGQLMEGIAPSVGGKGGGKPELAWGGGSRPEGIPAALDAARQYLEARLGSVP